MSETRGKARAAIIVDEIEFDARDHALLEAIQRTGSVAQAASELGRSRARSLARIEALETAFGTLVERRRGGSGGGGSRLTDNGRSMLDQYDRLAITLEAAARVPETVLDGTVTALDGELATVDTGMGSVSGLQDGVKVGDTVQLRIGADAITIHGIETTPDPDVTSARNRRTGHVVRIDRGETVQTVHVEIDGIDVPVLVTETSVSTLGLQTECRSRSPGRRRQRDSFPGRDSTRHGGRSVTEPTSLTANHGYVCRFPSTELGLSRGCGLGYQSPSALADTGSRSALSLGSRDSPSRRRRS